MNKASLALYDSMHHCEGAGPHKTAARPTWSLHCRVRLCDWCIKTCRYQDWESVLDAISMISGAGINQCIHILLMNFYHMHHYTMQLLGIWSSVHNICMPWVSATSRFMEWPQNWVCCLHPIRYAVAVCAPCIGVINPRRMRRRVTVVVLSVCLSVIELAATYLICTLKIRYH